MATIKKHAADDRSYQRRDSSAAPTKWLQIEQSSDFQELVTMKRRFIIPSTIFFIVYYFALPILVGYFPALMSKDVIGKINIGYLFALSQFFMAWILMAMYVKKAKTFDAQARKIVEKEVGKS